jgi:Purine catabolism regulatory protein-like family/PucR C-terminal helix-turn-helix domain
MALPTLRAILGLPAFHDAELLTGESQLDRVVTWVHVAEVLDVGRLLSGGELLLSTGLELARITPGARVHYLHSLAQADLRGLGLELVQWMNEVPEEMLEAAKAIDFPIVVFRKEVRFAELTRAAHERILRPHLDRKDEPPLQSVLDALLETGRDRQFMESQLGPVLSLPQRTRATLLSTLEALLEARFNIAETARRLGVRRQSIYYRLDQLNGLLGALDDPERQLGFLVALALLRRGSLQA